VPGRSYKPDKKLWTIPDSQSSVNAFLENLYQTNEFTTEEKENSTAGFTQGKIGQGITSSQELQKLKEILLTRHYSPRTIENYLFWAKKFLQVHRDSKSGGQNQINAFLTNLAVNENVSASTQNQALAALLFFFRFVRGEEPENFTNLIHAKNKKRAPVVLTKKKSLR